MSVDSLKFDDKGLIPIIAQSADDGQVLMFAWGNKKTIELSIETNKAHYWSRSRNKVWMKGEESGNTQKLVDVYYDCDKDVILYIVEQKGVACHTNEKSCFFTKIDGTNELSPSFEGSKNIKTLDDVYRVIEDRKANKKEGSYVSGLFEKGIDKIIKKIGEEAGEVIIGAKNADKEEIIYEVADLWFHSLIALSYFEIEPEEIYKELGKRFGKTKESYGRD
ncbi:MAG: bifunctional phosphoribosyl-AMP cyclohydrolase/phosphoribosyl-ATP diphosphatase HisIE [Candidatus Dadabacteria bacterium]|nr:bifunctional phosphoribosyl-AMP cyclohydrolase/phosphoribosyl-ATP diphosphatase HisIE [Candidatus Dadabacteria bacterium]NIS07465.1 bifunctional phosphoribosyl-AMP cyclohydrolase/phosphoribosyl-ATP diphosphatase HisIE [Candidatus Dadabacteria bacterium]NIV42450.1 bifunctional phosphoribosyl-AMP cyclohydrolase/phosphoribosyl-ATP diphosphatase HisIE [Candidatus Dadabacteria bacterium]NIY21109.1 bifunctional phosphoribosyl-AMP cyclohydrolase/phosphoribosyl-ATP diphosphatase HisIE [Candidatus Dad